MHYIRWNTGEGNAGLTEREMYKMLWERTGVTDKSGLTLEPIDWGQAPGEPDNDPADTSAEEIHQAAAEYRRMLRYALDGCRHLIWKTAFDLNKPELSATQAQEIVFQLGQMANDLDSYEAEAERLGLGK